MGFRVGGTPAGPDRVWWRGSDARRVRPTAAGVVAGTVAQDVRYAVRGILAHRWFSAAIIATLALGIGLNTMVFTLVNAVL